MSANPIHTISHKDILNYSKEELLSFFNTQKDYVSQLLKESDILLIENDNFLKRNDLLLKENEELKKYKKILEDKILEIEGQLVVLKSRLFRKKSEKSKSNPPKSHSSGKKKTREKSSLLPSERYPEAAIFECHVGLKELPNCSCCGHTMVDSGMTEDSEFLTVVPKDYFIILQRRHKYRCQKCHGDIKTAPNPPKIVPGSVYSDEMMIDIAMSKYCDLIPIERYSSIAGREGLVDLPPNSLIGTTHKLAEYIEPAYEKVKEEIKSSEILHADETPHRMLEGDEKKNWYLWCFSNKKSSYFEIRNTRSGDVASELLTQSICQYLVSDVFSGYAKAVKESNKIRENNNLPSIFSVYCNAHSRRKFKEASDSFPEEAEFYMGCYKKIYQLEKEGQKQPGTLADKRMEMKAVFEDMKKTAEAQKDAYSAKSVLVTAINYFLKNYAGLTLFLMNPYLPIDNNPAERQLRSPVIGRKTWFGTHSKQGAKTTAIFFTLVESCKLNNINPRLYFRKLVQQLHDGKPAFTPKEYKALSLDTG